MASQARKRLVVAGIAAAASLAVLIFVVSSRSPQPASHDRDDMDSIRSHRMEQDTSPRENEADRFDESTDRVPSPVLEKDPPLPMADPQILTRSTDGLGEVTAKDQMYPRFDNLGKLLLYDRDINPHGDRFTSEEMQSMRELIQNACPPVHQYRTTYYSTMRNRARELMESGVFDGQVNLKEHKGPAKYKTEDQRKPLVFYDHGENLHTWITLDLEQHQDLYGLFVQFIAASRASRQILRDHIQKLHEQRAK